MRQSTQEFDVRRYHPVLVILHWLMAVAILLMLASGGILWLADLPQTEKFILVQYHKSLGILILLLFIIRVLTRLLSTSPKPPESLSALEKKAASFGHQLLYLFMGIIPLSGWIMVSASQLEIPMTLFGWFEWPKIPGLQGSEPIRNLSGEMHFYGAITLLILVSVHVAAVIKHKLIDDEALIARLSLNKFSTLWVFGLALLFIVVSAPFSYINLIDRSDTQLSVYPIKNLDESGEKSMRFVVDQSGSTVGFNGTYSSEPFVGQFTKWQAVIFFDAGELDKSHFSASFNTASATTGESMYDSALKEMDWFNVNEFPEATFESTRIEMTKEDKFKVHGLLTIRGVSQPLTFIFTLSDLSKDPVFANARFVIDRFDYGIGATADAEAEWVSRDITVDLSIKASRLSEPAPP